MLLVVDNLSSFMPDLVRALDTLDTRYVVKRYTELASTDGIAGEYDGIILSGRKRNERSMNVINMNIVGEACREDRPLLGICYGAEVMALAMHGTIRRVGRITGEEEVYVHEDNPIAGSGVMLVYESHDYSIATLPSVLKSVAYSRSCSNEIVMHASKPIFGTQFHPEASYDHGLELLRRFVMLTNR
ncbi:MAG: gamma-glutamyl-gamma-aminobutyrate hydrolase family protein [Candidatus Nitrosocaldus sp.]|nr:gamma-glutamyl-gamma-aminobutyrate hydrolase family protein [Candidatus Nitrosocaldus sp.]MDW7999750.1 gamma-glutamyl-gamma-aminobutyrate hydrolase family protein [Candidatus Nitrosocaldus sp.]